MATAHRCPACNRSLPLGVPTCCAGLTRAYVEPIMPALTASPQDFAEAVAATTQMPPAHQARWLATVLAERIQTVGAVTDPDPAAGTILTGVLLAAIRRYAEVGE